MELPTKVEAVDMLVVKNYELQLENLQLKFQSALEGLWSKYQLKKGEDSIRPDGTIVRKVSE